MSGRDVDDLDRKRASLDRYLSIVRRYQLNPDRPAAGGIWCPELECAPREMIRALQDAKVAAAYEYLFACSPFHQKRLTAAGLHSGSVKSVADLLKVPVTRKTDWIADVEQNPPWGTFSPLL